MSGIKIVSRNHRKIPKHKAKNHVIPLHQSQASISMKTWYTIPQSPAPATNSLASGRDILFDLESYETNVIESIAARFTVTNSGSADVQLAPSAYWIERIVIEAERGTSDELNYIYPEQIVFYYWSILSNEEREYWSKKSNFSIGRFEDGTERYFDDESTILRAGETRDIYMPFPVAWLHMSAIDMKHILGDLRFRFQMNNDFVVSGTKSDVTLDDLVLFICSTEETEADRQARKMELRSNHHKYIYLDAERLTLNDKSLNAGSEQRFNLDQYVGKAAFILVFIMMIL